MAISPLSDEKILDSWHKNVSAWTQAVREGQIESRKWATDQAIVATVLAQSPKRVLDVGCGEGWLARTLTAHGVEVLGVDAVPELIHQAQVSGGGRFAVMSYEQLASGVLREQFDAVVANFSLLGNESVEQLLRAVPALLNPGGTMIVQTVHPLGACGDLAYQDGWRTGSWQGFSSEFTDPAPWYFRTLEGWVRLFIESGFNLREIKEPVHPITGKPASVIFVGVPDNHTGSAGESVA